MLNNSDRKSPLKTPEQVRGLSKNMKRYLTGEKVLQQGIIEGDKQNVHNVEQIIKYLDSNAFRRMLDAAIADWMSRNPVQADEGGNADAPAPPGEQGMPGSPGSSGQDGEQGASGADGSQGEQGIQGDKGDKGDKGDPGEPGISDFGRLYLTVNGNTAGVTGTPYFPPETTNRIFNIDLTQYIQENPFYPMKYQVFEANTVNGYTQYNGQVHLNSDTQVILVKKMVQNAIGIRFYNMNASSNNERVLFVHMSADSPITDNVQILFSTGSAGGSAGVNLNARLQEADLVFISRNFCMFQPIGSGGSMN
jgi:hypothetical protein